MVVRRQMADRGREEEGLSSQECFLHRNYYWLSQVLPALKQPKKTSRFY